MGYYHHHISQACSLHADIVVSKIKSKTHGVPNAIVLPACAKSSIWLRRSLLSSDASIFCVRQPLGVEGLMNGSTAGNESERPLACPVILCSSSLRARLRRLRVCCLLVPPVVPFRGGAWALGWLPGAVRVRSATQDAAALARLGPSGSSIGADSRRQRHRAGCMDGRRDRRERQIGKTKMIAWSVCHD
jgi:hypothetical protein